MLDLHVNGMQYITNLLLLLQQTYTDEEEGTSKVNVLCTTFGAIFWMEPNLAAFGCWQTLAFFLLWAAFI